MKSIAIKTLNVVLFSVAITWSYGQTRKENQVVTSKEISTIKKTELKSVKVEKKVVDSKKKPEIIQSVSNKPAAQTNYPQKVTIHKENLPKTKSSVAKVSMTKDEEINSLKNRISSLESKIALLEDDAETNLEEILEKKKLLNELKTELSTLQK